MPTETSRSNGLFSTKNTYLSPGSKGFSRDGLDDIQLHLSQTSWWLWPPSFQAESAIWHPISIPESDVLYFQQPGTGPRQQVGSASRAQSILSASESCSQQLAGSSEAASHIKEPFLHSPQCKPASHPHPLTFNLNRGCPRRRQSLYVVSFAGEHCALINTWKSAKKRKENKQLYNPAPTFSRISMVWYLVHAVKQLESWAGCQSKAHGFQCN